MLSPCCIIDVGVMDCHLQTHMTSFHAYFDLRVQTLAILQSMLTCMLPETGFLLCT